MEFNSWHCECIRLFKICLKNLNSSLASEVSLLYSLNVTKCYADIHPITVCIQYEDISDEIKIQLFSLMTLIERETYLMRCVEYALDKSTPKLLQIVDAPFDVHSLLENL